jgi:hypothetical protein
VQAFQCFQPCTFIVEGTLVQMRVNSIKNVTKEVEALFRETILIARNNAGTADETEVKVEGAADSFRVGASCKHAKNVGFTRAATPEDDLIIAVVKLRVDPDVYIRLLELFIVGYEI